MGPVLALAAGADDEGAIAISGAQPSKEASDAAYTRIFQIGEDYESSQRNHNNCPISLYKELLENLDTRGNGYEDKYLYLSELAVDLQMVKDWGLAHGNQVTDSRSSLFTGYSAVKTVFENMVKIRSEEYKEPTGVFKIDLDKPVSFNMMNWTDYVSKDLSKFLRKSKK